MATNMKATTYFTHADWLGTERARSNVADASYETCTGLPFGDSLTCSGGDPSPMHFTGKEHDNETGLENFGAHYCAEGPITFAAILAMKRRGASRSLRTIIRFRRPEITQLWPCSSPRRPTRATASAVSAIRNARSGCCATCWNSVVVEPGQRAQTRTPKRATSSAIPSAKIRSNAFVAA